MTQRTVITGFSGGGLADLGYMAAGYTPIGAVEYDPAICEVYRANVGPHIRCESIFDTDWSSFDRPDLLHMSPECKEFSTAKTAGVEGPVQRAQADAVCRALVALGPRAFVLENVVGYRRSPYSLPKILDTLARLGYLAALSNVNCADHGVPQTRRRLIVRAVRGELLRPLLGRERWVGWYAAIADLIPTLPESAFAPWQLARLAPLFGDTLVSSGTINRNGRLIRERDEPSTTIIADSERVPLRGFLAHPTADNPRFPVRDTADPSFVIGAGGNLPRGFLPDGNSSGQEWGKLYRAGDEPAFTTKIITRPDSHMPRAFLIDGGNTELANPTSRPRDEDDPAFTVAGNDSATTNQRAFIVDDQHNNRVPLGLTDREAERPVFTVSAGANKPARAWLDQGRVVAMTPRALARFMSLGDDYLLPDSRSLACRVLGNGVPPLLSQAIGESLKGAIDG